MLYRLRPAYVRSLLDSLNVEQIATIDAPAGTPPDVRSITLAGAVADRTELDVHDPALTWVVQLGARDEFHLKTMLRHAHETGIVLADANQLMIHVQNLADDLDAGNFLNNPVPCDWLGVCFIWRPVEEDLQQDSLAARNNLATLQTHGSIAREAADLAKRAWLAVAHEQNQDPKNWGRAAQKAGATIITTVGGDNEIGPGDFSDSGFDHVVCASGEPPLILAHRVYANLQKRAQLMGKPAGSYARLAQALLPDSKTRPSADRAPLIIDHPPTWK